MQPGHCRAARQGAGRMSRAQLRRDAGRLAGAARRGRRPGRRALESQASGLFINAAGQVLTAAHAVTGCASLYALKDGRCATVVARDDARPGLAGYRFQAPSERDLRGHARGQRRPARVHRGLWRIAAHARARKHRVQWHDGPARRRFRDRAVAVLAGQAGRQRQSRAGRGRAGARHGGRARGGGRPAVGHGGIEPARRFRARAGATRVKAVPVDSITGFLREQGAVHAVSDRPQLGAMQAQARATLSAGIICG